MTYLDEFLDSPRSHPYILKDIRVGPPQDTVYAACLKRPCLLSASLTGSLGGSAHQVRVAKDLLPMASNSSGVVDPPEYPLSHAVDANPRTYFESKQGSLPIDTVTTPLKDFRSAGRRFVHVGPDRSSWVITSGNRNGASFPR